MNDLPRNPDQISARWLTKVLEENQVIRNSSVTDIRSEQIGADIGMTANLYRIWPVYDSPEANTPSTLIAKFSAADQHHRVLHARLGFYEREVRFYELLSEDAGIGTPKAFFSGYDHDSQEMCLLIEDLGYLRAVDDSDDCKPEDATKAIKALASMHGKWWNHSGLKDFTWLLDSPMANSPERAQTRYMGSLDRFFEIVEGRVPGSLEDLAHALGPNIPRLSTQLAEVPTTLCHGDFKAGNLMFDDRPDSSRPVVAFDWQMPGRLKGARDLAHFLMYAFDPESRRNLEPKLIRIYLEELRTNGIHDYSESQLRQDVRIALLLRFAGRVTSLVNGGASMLASTEGRARLMASVERLQALIDWNCEEVIPG